MNEKESDQSPIDKEEKVEEIKIGLVNSDDLMNVYDVSNQESVRSNSFNPQRIELEDHKRWLESKLKDPNYVMLKAVVGESFAGLSRIEIEREKAVIGVSVSENFRGRGLASKLLEAAISQAKEKRLVEIEAYIKPENQASIGLFQKIGFAFAEETEVSGCKALKLIYRINSE